jgi:3',5'-nucleoside bisphosphate phosphatase
LIDLHTHTTESDGSSTPAELVREAVESGLTALAITDHDTLAGYQAALGPAGEGGLELVCGIELSTKFLRRSVHLLGYFLKAGPSSEFRAWLREMQESRRDRNIRLAARLRSLGMDIDLSEVEAKGRGMTGRPHFARVMVEKGYVADARQAFNEFLDESARGYVERREPQLGEGIQRIRAAGGLPALPHPTRLAEPEGLDGILPQLVEMGLAGLEAYHSDHSPEQTDALLGLALRHGLAVTGGSDFHGDLKPGLRLGMVSGGTEEIPAGLLDSMREAARQITPERLGSPRQ